MYLSSIHVQSLCIYLSLIYLPIIYLSTFAGYSCWRKMCMSQITHPLEQVVQKSSVVILTVKSSQWHYCFGLDGQVPGILDQTLFLCFNFWAQYDSWVFIFHLLCAISHGLARQIAAHIPTTYLPPPLPANFSYYSSPSIATLAL